MGMKKKLMMQAAAAAAAEGTSDAGGGDGVRKHIFTPLSLYRALSLASIFFLPLSI